jgi:hypothetical protein
VLITLSVAAGFILHLARDIITHQPPSWLSTKTIKGPRLKTSDPSAPLTRFRRIADDARREASQRRVTIGPVQLYEVRKRGNEVVVWNLERFVNRGFDPQLRFQHILGIPDARLIGYYTLEGQQVPAILRRLTTSANQQADVELTVLQPVPPGGELFIIRLERSETKPAVSPQTGNFYLSLSYLPSTNTGVSCRAIQLPKGAEVVRYAPSDVAWTATEGAPMLGWENTQLPPQSPPPSLTFKMPP